MTEAQEAEQVEAQEDGAPETLEELAETGWQVVHDTQEDQTVVRSETQGRSQLVPRSIRAEKQVNGQLVSVEAATPELLVERAVSIDEQWGAQPQAAAAPLTAPTDPPEGSQGALVITNTGRFDEHEWAQRSRTDNVVTSEGQQWFAGVETEEGTAAKIEQAIADAATEANAAENERVSDPFATVETVQYLHDPSGRIDAPGQSAGDNLIVPADTDSLAEARFQMAARSQQAENERLAAQEQAQLEAGRSQREVADTFGPTREAQLEVEEERVEAIKEIRDQQEPAVQVSDEGAAEQQAAAAEGAAAPAEQGELGSSSATVTPRKKKARKKADVDGED